MSVGVLFVLVRMVSTFVVVNMEPTRITVDELKERMARGEK
jgi:hypothetical protein